MNATIFHTQKPILSLLHLDPLPGDPEYCGSMESVLKHAREDLHNLQDGGVDGVLFTNEFSFPYEDGVSPVTTASISYIIGKLRDEIRIPFGVQVIADNFASIDLAAAVGADFVRGVFTGAYINENGYHQGNIGKLIRRKKELGLDNLAMYYMVNAESDADVSQRDIATIAGAIAFKCHPDGLCLSGLHAGLQADTETLLKLRNAAGDIPVFFNTGCNVHNIAEKLPLCDGAFVGTGFKVDGKFENRTDKALTTRFMDIVKEYRQAHPEE